MNKVYKIVFNQTTQTYTAVSELAKGAKKSQTQSSVFRSLSSEQQAGTFLPKFAKIALAISMILGFSSSAMAVVSDAEFNALKARLDKLESINNAIASSGVTVGDNINQATGHDAIIVGGGDQNRPNKATAENSAILGGVENTVSSDNGAIVGGGINNVSGSSAIALGGMRNTVLSTNGATIGGYGNKVSGHSAITLAGHNNIALGTDSLAVGSGSKALGQQSISMGDRTIALGSESVAMGYRTEAIGGESTAMGIRTKAMGSASTTMGFISLAVGEGSLAAGGSPKAASKLYGLINIKDYETIKKEYSDVFTPDVARELDAITDDMTKITFIEKKIAEEKGFGGGQAYSDGSIALGTGTIAGQEVISRFDVEREVLKKRAAKKGITLSEADNSYTFAEKELRLENKETTYRNILERSEQISREIAVADQPNEALRKIEAVAMGYRAKATENNSLALGFDAIANNKNSVALGSKAETRAFTQEDSATVNGLKYKDFTGVADGVVSVGKDHYEKQIINVAPGKIAQTSTDAINGSQLFATNKAIGNVAKSVKNNFGGNAALNENGNITFTNIGGTGKGTIHEAIGDIKTTADAAKRKTLANSTTLNNKADKNAGNLSTADVAAWKRKIDTDTNSVERVTKGDGIEVTGGTTAKNKNWTVALSQDTKTKLAKIAQNETALGNKADKNAGNLGAAEVNAWTTKLNTGANITAPTGKLVTDSQVKTALDTKLDADDITSKDKSVTIDTKTTAGKVDLKINVDGSTIKVNDEGQLQAVASAPEVDGTSVALNSAGKVSVKDKGISAAKLADNAVTEDKIADALLTELKAKSREKVKAGAGIKVSPTTVAADKDNQEFTVSLSDAVKTKLDNLAANPNATYLNKTGSNIGNDTAKATFGQNVGKASITGNGTQLVQEKAVKSYVDGKAVQLGAQVKTVLDTKLDADDITSKDKTVTIDTTTTAGKVDLKINVDGSTIKVNDEGQLQAVASAPEVDGTSVALNSAGKVSVKDKGISAAKLADNAVTEDKIADALLTELKAKSREKVKAGAGIKVSPTTVAADKDNQEFTVSLSDAVKTKLDNLAANPNATYLNKTGSNIGNDTAKATFGQNVGKASITGNGTQLVQEKAVKSYVDGKAVQLGNQITNVSKTLKEEVAIVENSGLTLDTTAATTTKGAIYTLGLDAAKVKEVAGTTTLPADLAAKANKDASNLTDPADVGKWKKKLGIDGLPTNANIASKLEADDITSKDKSVTIDTKTTAGKVDLKINVDGSTIKVNDEGQLQAVASAPEVDGTSVALNSAGKVSVKDKGISAAKLADNAVTEDKIADALLTELKAKSREKVKAGAGIKVSPTTVAADKDNQEFTVSLSDAVKTKLDNLAANPNATYLNKTGSNIGNDTAKATFGQNVGKASITGNGTQLVQEKAVKSYVDGKAVQLGNQITNVSKTLKEEVAIVENSGLTLDTTAATTTKGAIYTLGLDAAKVKEVAGTTTLPADLAAKANKDASNLTDPADVGKWKEKLGIDGLATNSNIASKLEANDIISTDKTIGIDTKTTAGKVDLKVNLDGTTLAKNSKGAIGLVDNAVTTAKILNAAVTKEKLGTDVTTVLNKVGVGKVEAGNQNTVTGGAVKTYVDGKATELTTQITNVGKTSKEEVAIVENSGLTLTKTNATTEKGAKYTLGLDAEKVKEVAGTTNLATDYLKADGSNIANNKATLGQNVGKDTIDGKTTELVQEKAVKTYVDTALEKVGKAKDGKDGYIGVDGKDGKNGVGIDGKDGITVKGKDGKNGVTIKGEDGVNGTNGVIGLNGHDGIDGKPAKDVSADIKVVNGKAGVNGKDGESLTRVIYQDETGTTHTVATLDDGLVFAGNTPNKVMKALNDTLVIEGQKGTDPAKHLTKDAEFAADNIFVDTTDGKLEIKLAKKLQGVEGIGIAGKDGLSIAGKDGANGLNGKDGENAVAINGKDGISIKGKDGKDGISIKGADGIAVNGKDGKNGVTIKGEDGVNGTNGVIGLNGHDGIDGKPAKDVSADIKVVNGKAGVNGKDGESLTRVIYQDETGTTHTVATLDDGFILATDNGKQAVKLNDTLNIKGGVTETAKLSDNNIGVVNNGTDGLAVKLAKDLTGLDSIVFGAAKGNDVVSISNEGINAGGKRITNIGDATQDTDAVNYKQLKALNNGKGIDVAAWQKQILPTISFLSDGKAAGDFELGELAFDFGDGLKVEKQTKDGKQVAHITLDKETLKNDPNFKGKDGANGKDGKDGKSAYEIWKGQAGNQSKSEQDFILAQKGPKGDKGEPGTGTGSGSVVNPEKIEIQNTTINNKGVTVNKGANINVNNGSEISINKGGNLHLQEGSKVTVEKNVDINMGGNQIHNIAAGTKAGDAVNLAQLNKGLEDVRKGASSGTSSAMAAASLPQAYKPGHSMVSLAGASYDKAASFAVGVSSISDNGKWIIKGNLNANTEGKVGVGIGAGYQW
ncbi:YadA-like family protein [Pasteurella atlantica]|uniref:YadA-like family protein n=1 Tax=Pasteurella atlantica TaxID=2827233 RepID=UPI00277371E9|nr:YadA-like family protein [Pasteurella atlantica]MDP8105191.1 YadA-like family protein [Pasteurella atlantica]